MLTALVTFALRRKLVVVLLAVLLLVFGVRAARNAPLDVFPEFAPPLVEVQTEAPGLSTEEVESLVTVPLENALNGVPYLKKLRSKSVLGLSSVVLIFADGTDLIRARQIVQERLGAEASRLPAVAHAPVILSPLSSTSRAMKIGVSSKTLSQMDLTTLARWTIRPRLMAIPGVANVAIWGQRDRQLQVLVDPEQLHARGVSLDQVLKAAADATAVSAGGFLDSPNQRVAVRHAGSVQDENDLARAVVAERQGTPVLLGDVARVVADHPPPIGDAIIDDGPGLLLIVEKHPWGNTLDVTRKVEAALDALRPGLAGVSIDSTIFRPATFIERSLANLNEALGLGCLLVVVVLLVFLNDLRTALLSLIAIPLSLVMAALVLTALGATLNTMVLAGLVIAVGEVVDDAVIDVENILRRLRLNAVAVEPRSAFRVVLEASLEVRSAVVYASVIVSLVFLPVFFLDGLAGSFFRPLAFAYVLAILSSLLVALTVTPALLPRTATKKHDDPPLVRVLKRVYGKVLPVVVERPWFSLGVLALGLAASAFAVPRLGEEFLPDFQETDFLMHWVEKPGTSIDASRRATALVSKELRAIPGVRNFGSHIGRAEVADEVVGPNFTEFWISIDPGVDHATTVAKIEEVVTGYPGAIRDVLTYLKERIKEVLTGASATVVVRVYGPDLPTLRSKAQEVSAAIKNVPGVVDLKVEPSVIVPQVDVRFRPELAERFGLTAGQVRRAATTLLRGQRVGEVFDQGKSFDVVVWSEPRVRADVNALRDILIETPLGTPVRLGEVASVEVVSAPNEIKREDASRRIDVTLNVKDRDLGSVARDVEAAVRALSFDREYHPEFLGEYAAREASRRQLVFLSLVALAGIFVLLHADFGSLRPALLVFLTLPFALIGGVAAAFLGGGVLSLGSIIGFVTVIGIAARNGIMLVSHYRHLELVEKEPFGTALFLRGAAERLAPILMTALCAALALVPIVVRGKVPGHEIEHPMAIVILGGLVTSTALNLIFLPALYAKFAKPSEPEESVEVQP